MLRVWNVTLVIITFLLTIFGTFMTRSGVVQSVHAFGEDPRAGAAVHRLHGRRSLVFSFGWVIYRLPLLQGAPRARFVGVAGSGVPRQQLDPAVLGVLRPVRHDVPDDHRGDQRRAAHRRAAVLQPLDGADRPDPAAPHRRRPAAGVAQVDAREPARAVPVAGRCRRSSPAARWSALGVRVWSSGICFALCGFVIGTLDAGIHPRRATCGSGMTGTDLFTAMVGLVGAQQAPLRRLHRARRHRADLPRLRRRGLQPRRAAAAQARAAGARSATTRCTSMRMRVTDDGQKQMITGHITVIDKNGARARQDAPGEVVLPQARGRADDRSRDPPLVRRRPLHRDAGVRDRGADGQRRSAHQPARELGLVRLRHPGASAPASRCCRKRRCRSRSRSCPRKR